jgi:acyl carrier protein
VSKPSSDNAIAALGALQMAYDEVLPEGKRQLQLSDELIELGIGSIAALEMAASLEVLLGVEIADSDLFDLRTVEDFVVLVQEKRAGGEAMTESAV